MKFNTFKSLMSLAIEIEKQADETNANYVYTDAIIASVCVEYDVKADEFFNEVLSSTITHDDIEYPSNWENAWLKLENKLSEVTANYKGRI